MSKGLFIVKPVQPAGHVDAGEPVEGSLEGEASLKRTLTARQLVLLGVGAVIGAGIFVLSGHAAAEPPRLSKSVLTRLRMLAFRAFCSAALVVESKWNTHSSLSVRFTYSRR